MTMTLEKLLTDCIALQVNHIYFINKVTRFCFWRPILIKEGNLNIKNGP